MSELNELRDRAIHHGQEHIFAFWDQLDESQRTHLLGQLAGVDFDLVQQQASLLESHSQENEVEL
jgi:hypothetical protein